MKIEELRRAVAAYDAAQPIRDALAILEVGNDDGAASVEMTVKNRTGIVVRLGGDRAKAVAAVLRDALTEVEATLIAARVELT